MSIVMRRYHMFLFTCCHYGTIIFTCVMSMWICKSGIQVVFLTGHKVSTIQSIVIQDLTRTSHLCCFFLNEEKSVLLKEKKPTLYCLSPYRTILLSSGQSGIKTGLASFCLMSTACNFSSF